MTLPEPNFIERDINKITQEMIAKYEQDTGKTLEPAQQERLMIDLIAYRENLLRIGIQEAAKQNLVNYATYPMLDYLGELVGVTRLEPKKARTSMRAAMNTTKSFAVAVPAGTQIESKDGKVIFSTLENITIPVGQLYADVAAECETEGIAGNGYLQGEINNPISVVPNIDNFSNLETTSGGADEEADDPYRERIKKSPERYTNAGSKGAYQYHAASAHQDIIDVAVISPSAGTINVYPLTKNGNPTQVILDMVTAALNAEKTRPLTDNVNVLSPTKVDFEIITNVTLYDWADTEATVTQIQTNLDNYVAGLRVKLGKDIVSNQIKALINSVYGVYNGELESPDFDELADNEWANCTNIEINPIGYVGG